MEKDYPTTLISGQGLKLIKKRYKTNEMIKGAQTGIEEKILRRIECDNKIRISTMKCEDTYISIH